MWQDVLTIFIASALINNFVFSRYLGLCIFFGVTKKMETAVGMSFTFTGVMLIGAALNWFIYKYVMMPLHIGFLKIVIFIGVIAAFVQAADTIMKKVTPALYYKLGIYLALIITNCIILAVPLINADEYTACSRAWRWRWGRASGSAWRSSSWRASAKSWNLPMCPGPSRGCRSRSC